MHEALAAVESFAFLDLGMRQVQAHIAPRNFPSRRVAERRGYLCKSWRAADPQWDGETQSMLVYERRPGRN
jgi:RimJ/RimL family protein N-acetyltransferase